MPLRLLDWLLGPQDRRAPALRSTSNLVTMMLHPQGLRPLIANWEQVAADQLQLIHRESLIEGGDGAAGALLAHLLSIEGVPADWRTPNLDARHLPFMPLRLRRDDTSLELFTTISTLGTPHDVTLHELRIESFFPADPVTAEWFKLQALGAPGADG